MGIYHACSDVLEEFLRHVGVNGSMILISNFKLILKS